MECLGVVVRRFIYIYRFPHTTYCSFFCSSIPTSFCSFKKMFFVLPVLFGNYILCINPCTESVGRGSAEILCILFVAH